MYIAKGTDSQKVLIRRKMITFRFVLRDLEGHRPSVVCHDRLTSISFHFEVFDEQVGDVLRCGQARLLSGLADLGVEGDGYLCA